MHLKNYLKSALFLLTVTFSSHMSFAADIEVTLNQIEYTLVDSTKTAIISDTETTSITGVITIPETITYEGEEYTVTTVGEKAFNYCSKITSVVLPNTVTTLETSCFASSGITEIVLPESVTTIGEKAFYFCDDIPSFTLPASVDSVGSKAFYYMDITSFHVENSVPIELPSDCFYTYRISSSCNLYVPAGCVDAYAAADIWCNFKSISVACIKDGITYIVDDATHTASLAGVAGVAGDTLVIPSSFEDGGVTYTVTSIASYGLSSTTYSAFSIPATIEEIGDYAFSSNSNLVSIDLPSSISTIAAGTFYDCESLTTVNIPTSVTSIGSRAFANCDVLATIEIPSSVVSLGSYAFYYCTSMETIDIPASVAEIGSDAFAYCEILKYINIDAENKVYASMDGIVYSKDLSTLYTCPVGKTGELVIPDNVITIGEAAFERCDSLTAITLSNNLKVIENTAFSTCLSLTSIDFPASLTSIGDEAFFVCNLLTSVILPDSLTHIGEDAFFSCAALKTISIPASVTYIGPMAFCSCRALQSLFVATSTPLEIESNTFTLSYEYSTLYVPAGSVEAYTAATGWSLFTSIAVAEKRDDLIFVLDEDTKTATLNGSFGELGSDLVVPESILVADTLTYTVTNIAQNAFVNNTDIVTVTLPSTIKEIGVEAFAGCTNLESIDFGGAIEVIEDYAFENCTSLQSVDFPNTLSLIGAAAFSYCTSLSAIEIPNSVGYIGAGAFAYATGVSVINLPASIETMDEEVFAGCTSLVRVYVENATPLAIPSNTFSESTASLGALYVPAGSEWSYLTDSNWSIFSTIATAEIVDDMSYVVDEATQTATLVGHVRHVEGAIAIPATVVGSDNTTYTVASVADYAFLRARFITSIDLPNDIAGVGALAFAGCEALTSIELPESTTAIGANAFALCYSLNSVSIPAAVSSIGLEAFYYCSSLETITVDSESEYFTTIDNVLYDIDLKTLYAYPIGSTAETIVFPETLETIKASTFAQCPYIKSIVFPESLVTLEAASFSYCTALEYVYIPSSLETLGTGAFFSCENMVELHVNLEVPFDLEYQTFYHCYTGCTLYVPLGCTDAYTASYFWGLFDFLEEEDFAVTGIEELVAVSPLAVSKVAAVNGVISIVSAEIGTPITIYDLTGAVVFNAFVSNETMKIEVPQQGLHLVKIGSQVTKVVL